MGVRGWRAFAILREFRMDLCRKREIEGGRTARCKGMTSQQILGGMDGRGRVLCVLDFQRYHPRLIFNLLTSGGNFDIGLLSSHALKLCPRPPKKLHVNAQSAEDHPCHKNNQNPLSLTPAESAKQGTVEFLFHLLSSSPHPTSSLRPTKIRTRHHVLAWQSAAG